MDSHAPGSIQPNTIVRGAIFAEPVQVIVVVPMDESVKLIGKGLTSRKIHETILNAEQPAGLEPSQNGFRKSAPKVMNKSGLYEASFLVARSRKRP
jgi:hypothetical protein